MTDQDLIERITRSLAYMLRHRPERFDLELDAHGFGDLDEVARAVSERLGEDVDGDDLRDAVEAGTRRRYEIKDESIRALYGHSIPIEPGPDCEPPDVLYLGLPSRDVERAQRNGLRGGRRSYLHLALSEDDARESGRRMARDYTILKVLAIDAWEEGTNFYDRQALFLAERVPTEFLEVAGEYEDGEDPEPRRGGGEGRRSGSGGRSRGGRGRGEGGRGGGGRGEGRGEGRDNWREQRSSEPPKEREPERGRGRSNSDRESRDDERPIRPRRRPVARDQRDEPQEQEAREPRGERKPRSARPEREDRPSPRGRSSARREESGRGESSERPRRSAASASKSKAEPKEESTEGFGLGIFEAPKSESKPARASKARSKPRSKPEPKSKSKPDPEPAPEQNEDSGFGFGVGL